MGFIEYIGLPYSKLDLFAHFEVRMKVLSHELCYLFGKLALIAITQLGKIYYGLSQKLHNLGPCLPR